MSGVCTRQRQYSLCASPTRERKSRRQKSNIVIDNKSAPQLIHHTLKVPVVTTPSSTPPALVVDKKKPPRNTLKRKREIRDVLRANNEDYADNFFHSTPLRTRKLIKYPITDILVKEPEDDENDSSIYQNLPFDGNSMTSPVNIHYLFTSPPTLSASIERKNADVIVLRMQKSRRCRKHVIRATPKVCNSSVVTQSTKAIDTRLFHNTTKTDRGNLSSEDDSYFSNAEDEEVETI